MREVEVTPRRRFLKHVVLVLLPLVLLTAMAVSWLRQDQYAVKESVKEVAKLSTKESARRIQERVLTLAEKGRSNALASLLEFKLTEDGRLLSPAPRDLWPVPRPYLVEQLEAKERALWLRAMAVEAEGTMEVRSNAWSEFLAKSSTNEWQALGQYHLALTIAKDHPTEASQLLKEVFMSPTTVKLDSGLPLVPLAEWKWILMNSNLVTTELMHHFRSNTVTHPSMLTSHLLLSFICATGDPMYKWTEQWYRDETARQLHAEGNGIWDFQKSSNNNPRLHWLDLKGYEWLVLQRTNGTEVVAVSFKDVGEVMQEELRASVPKSPTLVYQVKVAGKVLVDPFAEGEIKERHQVKVPVEAETMAVNVAGEGDQAVEVTAFLWQNRYYRAERRERFLMFTAIISLAVTAALTGLASAFRTFQEQCKLSEMKSNFVSSVSHELRAPLASVRLMAESLERGKVNEPERQQEYFQLIGRECRRLTALIENVLDFARMDQGRKEYQMEPTDLVMLFKHTVSSMKPYAAERQVHLELEIKGEVRDVELDGQAIQQALVNLIDNAVKFSPAQGVVKVYLEFVPEHVLFRVVDQGPGIPREEHKRIFERFYRRGRELRRETQGVGIGLSIVKHVVDAHGGQILLNSEVGEGSDFTIIIRVGDAGKHREPVAPAGG